MLCVTIVGQDERLAVEKGKYVDDSFQPPLRFIGTALHRHCASSALRFIGTSVCTIAFLMLTLFVSSAQAGTWTLHVSGACTAIGTDGYQNTPAITWNAPADATNSITIPGGLNSYGAPGGSGRTATATANLNATITATWVKDPNLPSDPAPPSIMVYETSTATAYSTVNNTTNPGTVDDGIGDKTPDSTGLAMGKHYAGMPNFTLSLALSAKASKASTAPYWVGTPGPGGTYYSGQATAYASVGSINISIHAQPYNYHKVPGGGNMVSMAVYLSLMIGHLRLVTKMISPLVFGMSMFFILEHPAQ